MKNPNIRVIPAQQAWGLPNFMPFGSRPLLVIRGRGHHSTMRGAGRTRDKPLASRLSPPVVLQSRSGG